MKKVVITQSNYIPWKGYFDAMRVADEFVLYDDMQYTKRDWRNRNRIKTPQGSQWLTIPVEVKGKFNQKINETLVSDQNWNMDHWKSLSHNYKKASCYNEMKDFIEYLYMNVPSDNLSEINAWFLSEIGRWMGIKTKISFSGDYKLEEERTDRLVSICNQIGATDYYTGPAAKNYMEEGKFAKMNIGLHYFDYSGYPEYDQLYAPFDHAVSIIDLLFNSGKNFLQYMKYK